MTDDRFSRPTRRDTEASVEPPAQEYQPLLDELARRRALERIEEIREKHFRKAGRDV